MHYDQRQTKKPLEIIYLPPNIPLKELNNNKENSSWDGSVEKILNSETSKKPSQILGRVLIEPSQNQDRSLNDENFTENEFVQITGEKSRNSNKQEGDFSRTFEKIINFRFGIKNKRN